jgi:hypothetical protein
MVREEPESNNAGIVSGLPPGPAEIVASETGAGEPNFCSNPELGIMAMDKYSNGPGTWIIRQRMECQSTLRFRRQSSSYKPEHRLDQQKTVPRECLNHSRNLRSYHFSI